MNYQITKIDNGLRVLTVPILSLDSTCLTIWVKSGSRFEPKKVSGISHFLEHMAFKGGRKYKTQAEVTYILDSLGAEYNAGTSQEWTNFYIKLRSDNIEKAFEILSDMIIHPNLERKEIDKERGVILEEIAMHLDNPMWDVDDIFSGLIFPDNALGRDIAGSPGTIKTVSRNDFISYRRDHYNSPNMLITVSGGIDKNRVYFLSNKYFGELKKGTKGKYERFKVEQKYPRIKLKTKKTEQAHLIFGYYGHSRTHPDRFAEGLLSIILGRGMSSRLFSEIRTKRGLAYTVATSLDRFMDCGVFATYAGVRPDNIFKTLEIISDQTYAIASGKYPITPKELQKAKEYVKGKTALGLEDTIEVNEFFGQRALFMPHIDTPVEFYKKVDEVKLEDIERVAKEIFVPERVNLAIIGPYKDQNKFEKILS